ncbi:unnamed protein product [Sphagnum tenellum]
MKPSLPVSVSLQLSSCRGGVALLLDGKRCLLFVLFVVYLSSLGCHSYRLLNDDPDFTPNGTVAADNTCLMDIVDQHRYRYYALDTRSCTEDFEGGYLSVAAYVYPRNTIYNGTWGLLVNTGGKLPSVINSSGSDDGDDDNDDGTTLTDIVDSEDWRPFAQLDLPLGDNLDSLPPWFASVYSENDPFQFTIKAWCSVSKGCNLSCSDPDSGPCVSPPTCRCIRDVNVSTCTIDVEQLPASGDLVQGNGSYIMHNEEVLRPGDWKYFEFTVLQSNSRILVELARAHGDVCLFLKPSEGKTGIQALPLESDANDFSDLLSFQNRLSYDHIFIRGSGTYYIGVFNADHCLHETTYFNTTISIVNAQSSQSLCPLNCSFPQGVCIRDNDCHCEPGYGGSFCEGSLRPAKPKETLSGQLQPGDLAYITLNKSEIHISGINISVQFNYNGGNPILLAQQSQFPTLTDYDLKFSNGNLSATAASTYEISDDLLAGGNVILAVFNVDYHRRGEAEFEILILGATNGLAMWITIVVALSSSAVLFVSVGTCIYVLHHRTGREDGNVLLDFEGIATSEVTLGQERLDTVVVSTFPLLAFEGGLFLEEEARCCICLSRYSVGELLRQIPICKHVFHENCILEWFQTHSSCPLCRVSLQNLHRPSMISPAIVTQPRPSHFSGTEGLDPQISSSNYQSLKSSLGELSAQGGASVCIKDTSSSSMASSVPESGMASASSSTLLFQKPL